MDSRGEIQFQKIDHVEFIGQVSQVLATEYATFIATSTFQIYSTMPYHANIVTIWFYYCILGAQEYYVAGFSVASTFCRVTNLSGFTIPAATTNEQVFAYYCPGKNGLLAFKPAGSHNKAETLKCLQVPASVQNNFDVVPFCTGSTSFVMLKPKTKMHLQTKLFSLLQHCKATNIVIEFKQ